MTSPNGPPSGVTDLIFVYAYHDLPGVSEGEWVEYYRPTAIEDLRQDLTRYVDLQLGLFSRSYDYEDFFCCAEYDGIWDSLDETEVALFRQALPVGDRNTAFQELDPIDSLQGLRTAILHHIEAGDLRKIKRALELFDLIIECAVEGVDQRNPRSYIRLEDAAEFAPRFITRLLESVESLNQPWRYKQYWNSVGESFAPLKPLLEKLAFLVRHGEWPKDDLALGRLLLIVDYFKQTAEERSAQG